MTGVAQSSRLVGTVMGEQKVLWGRPERLTHAGTHGAPDSPTSGGAPLGQPAAPARAARTKTVGTAGGVA
jgi:hypothetical protein